MKILFFVFFFPVLAFADPLTCADGTLKVALCNSSATAVAFPVQQVLVCQQASSGFAIQSAVITPTGDTTITPPQPAQAKRLNDSQVQYSSDTNTTALVLNGDRQSGVINYCASGGNTNCLVQAAVCQ
jgi:hypothetical protein